MHKKEAFDRTLSRFALSSSFALRRKIKRLYRAYQRRVKRLCGVLGGDRSRSRVIVHVRSTTPQERTGFTTTVEAAPICHTLDLKSITAFVASSGITLFAVDALAAVVNLLFEFVEVFDSISETPSALLTAMSFFVLLFLGSVPSQPITSSMPGWIYQGTAMLPSALCRLRAASNFFSFLQHCRRGT